MNFTTRTKITALFVVIVSGLILALNILIFEGANDAWQKKKNEYMAESMHSMDTPEQAMQKFNHIEITDPQGVVVFRKGVFERNPVHTSLKSWLFHDPLITRAEGHAYFWMKKTTDSGYIFTTVDDVSDIIMTRQDILWKGLLVSLFGIFSVAIIGYFFSGYILRPISNMNEATKRFSLSDKRDVTHVGIYGSIKDEVVVLARSLEELFARVNKEAERLEQFSDDIAHEIKNKLFEVQSSLELATHTQSPQLAINRAIVSIKGLGNVVDALLFFARNDVGNPTHLSIQNLLETSQLISDPRVRCIWEAYPERDIYPELFLTAFDNIVSNALKFTPSDKCVYVTLTTHSIVIRDEGIGIDKTHIAHIFDRLYKVDNARSSGSGHGLGLSIAKKIIEDLHSMRLSLESEKGVGTTFFIHFG